MVRHKSKRKSKFKLFLVSLLVLTGVVYTCKSVIIPGGRHELYKNSGSKTTPAPSLTKTSKSSVSISTDILHSHNAVLVRLSDHSVLMQERSEEKIYPASLTKMMTAIVALENLPDLQQKITLQSSMFRELYKANAALAGFQPGEKVSAIDLIYGVLLPSGAECCMALANQIAGSEQNFVKLMNKKASDLGMSNTHFQNSTGLHDKNHYTTVKDLAILLDYALQNDTFRRIFTSSVHTSKPTNKHPGGITFNSTMFEELNGRSIAGCKILGGKTGYTDEAGLCLASLAKEGSNEYILVTAGAEGNHKSEQYNITDALVVYNSLGKQ